MLKKIIAGTIISAMTLFALPSNEFELTLLSKAAQKKAIVLSNMGLKGEVKQNFSKLYDEYQQKLMKHRIKELQLIANYAVSYNKLTNKNSDKLIVEWVTTEEAEIVLKKRLYC